MLVDSFAEVGRVIVIGPVEPRFEAPPPPWIVAGQFFRKQCNAADEPEAGYTSNVMMRTSAIAASGVLFDETLNFIGGEDVVFFCRHARARI